MISLWNQFKDQKMAKSIYLYIIHIHIILENIRYVD